MRLAVLLAGMAALQVSPATLAAKPARASLAHNWTSTVVATEDGGFRMGNPEAKVKLIEFGSLTCPHCRTFEETGVPQLLGQYVKSGQVSWEFRNYVRDPFDLTASLVVRCNGSRSFFPLMRALYKDQAVWLGKLEAVPRPQLEALQNLPRNRQLIEAAKLAGLPKWAAARGLPVAKSTHCLADQQSIDQLVQKTADVTNHYPDFQGTPAFVLNGDMVKFQANGGSVWDQLKVAIDKALGG